MIRKAAAQDGSYAAELAALHDKHLAAAAQLLGGAGAAGQEELDAFGAALATDMESIKSILSAIMTGAQLLIASTVSVANRFACGSLHAVCLTDYMINALHHVCVSVLS